MRIIFTLYYNIFHLILSSIHLLENVFWKVLLWSSWLVKKNKKLLAAFLEIYLEIIKSFGEYSCWGIYSLPHLWIIIIITIHPRTIHHDLCWQVINSSELTWVSAQHPKLSFDKARFKLHPLTHTSHSLVSSGAAPQQTIHFNYKHYEETRIQIIRYLLVTAAKPLCAIPIPRTSYTSTSAFISEFAVCNWRADIFTTHHQCHEQHH